MNNQETIQELEMDIQYLTDKVANGWYNGQDEKNNILAEREYLEGKLISEGTHKVKKQAEQISAKRTLQCFNIIK